MNDVLEKPDALGSRGVAVEAWLCTLGSHSSPQASDSSSEEQKKGFGPTEFCRLSSVSSVQSLSRV